MVFSRLQEYCENVRPFISYLRFFFFFGSVDYLAHINSTIYVRISRQWHGELRRLWPNVPWQVACELVSDKFPQKNVLPPLLPGFELATFRSRVRRSYQQAIPAPTWCITKCPITDFVDGRHCGYLWHFPAVCFCTWQTACWLFGTILQLHAEPFHYSAIRWHRFTHSFNLFVSLVCYIGKTVYFHTSVTCTFFTCSMCGLAHAYSWWDVEWRENNELEIDQWMRLRLVQLLWIYLNYSLKICALFIFYFIFFYIQKLQSFWAWVCLMSLPILTVSMRA